MKSRTILLGLMLLALLCAIAIPARAQAGNAEFQQAVAAYQQSQTTEAAEKVIRMAAAMDRLPPIPEEARRHFVRGTALFKDAKSPDDYKQVVDEFTQAIRIAPWWPDARYNRALAREAAGDYANAIVNLKFYLLFKLSDADARAAQDKIYALEAKQEKAARPKYESTTQPAAPQENSFDALLRKIDGRRYSWDYAQTQIGGVDRRYINVKGSVFIMGILSWGRPNTNGDFPQKQLEITGRETTERWTSRDFPLLSGYAVYTISDDGERITKSIHYQSGATDQQVFNRER